MKLKIVHTKFIPNGFKYVVVLIWLLCHRDPNAVDYQHENIHLQQELELLFVGFYLWYAIEWIIRVFQYKFDMHMAYHNVSFEVEAYTWEKFENYLRVRNHYKWMEYLRK